MTPRITMLNAMAAADFATALDRHVAWGLEWLGLKDCVLGKALLELTDAEAARAAAMIRERDLRTCCLYGSRLRLSTGRPRPPLPGDGRP